MSSAPRVVHLTTATRPQDRPFFTRECRTVATSGYEVVVVAPCDDHEQHDGVRIVPVAPPSTRAARLVVTPFRILRVAWREHADVYHVQEASLLPIAMVLALFNRRVVYDVREDLGLTLLDREWIPQWVRPSTARAARIVERFAVRHCDAVICAEPAAARRFPAGKTTLLQNVPALDEFDASTGRSHADRDPLAIYVGDITRPRGARELVDAIALVPADLGARLVLAGRFSGPGLRRELEALDGWSWVDFVGWLPRTEVSRRMRLARVGLVTLHPTRWQVVAQPVKLFEYMAMGLPVVASDIPGWRAIAGDAAMFVDPFDASAIADALAWVLTHPSEAEEMGARGRRAIERRFRWDHEAPKLLELYGRLGVPRRFAAS